MTPPEPPARPSASTPPGTAPPSARDPAGNAPPAPQPLPPPAPLQGIGPAPPQTPPPPPSPPPRARRWNLRRPGWRAATFALAAAVLALDQAVKALVDRVLPPGGATVGPLFDFRRIHNPGINFGLLADRPALVLWATTAVGVVFVGYVLLRPPDRYWTLAGLALLLGGGFGNVIDRFRQGAVFDYLNITPFVGYLNLADLAIGAGVLALVLETWRRRQPA